MKAQDLRIGNLIYSNLTKENFNVRPEDIVNIYIDNSTVEPIPLTEEWLLEFGFEKENNTKSKSHGSYFSMHILDYKYCLAFANFRNDWGFYQEYTDSPFEEDENKKYFISCGIISVHQLQNLYHALIGEELTSK